LLDRLRQGDTGAGQVLVERHYLPLMRYLNRLAGPRAAEDLHQQTWLSVLAHADRFVASGDAGSFRGWLFRIAANKSKDYWRSAGREKKAKDGYARIMSGESPWAGHAADEAEQREKLLRALEQLPESQREVLLLRYYSSMKFGDIADVIGCPLNTALTRAHKALLKLREALAA
jgi:RNA polymerase sigma-70 factor (ECF subfamily)